MKFDIFGCFFFLRLWRLYEVKNGTVYEFVGEICFMNFEIDFWVSETTKDQEAKVLGEDGILEESKLTN